MMMVPLAAFLIAWMLARVLLRAAPGSRLFVLDRPNTRSLHATPVPRTGGLAILGAVLPLIAWSAAGLMAPLFGLEFAVLVVAGVSFLDDRGGVPVGPRLAAHLLAALIAAVFGFRLPDVGFGGLPPWLLDTLSIIALVWGINLYNFMDGMDGFAGGMAVIGFSVFALFGLHVGDTAFFMVNAIIALASLGFLAFNFPPARLFMGDVGSAPLGLFMVANAFWGVRDGCFPLWVPILVFAPFLVDSTVTLIGRLWRRERVWQAHRSHYYQRLVQLGWGHRRTVLAEYTLMILGSLSAWIGATQAPWVQSVILGGWTLIYLILGIAVGRLERHD